jgi:hypothetical protein
MNVGLTINIASAANRTFFIETTTFYALGVLSLVLLVVNNTISLHMSDIG